MIPILWGEPLPAVGFSRGLDFLLLGFPLSREILDVPQPCPGSQEMRIPQTGGDLLGQLLSHPMGSPRRNSQSSSLGFPTPPKEPLGYSCLDPAVPQNKPQIPGWHSRNFHPLLIFLLPFEREDSDPWILGFAPFSHPEAGLGLRGNIRKLLQTPGVHKVLPEHPGKDKRDFNSCCRGLLCLLPAGSDPGSPIQPWDPGWDFRSFPAPTIP